MGLGTAALAFPVLFSNCMGKRRPNIIFIMSDDHAEQAISAYGSKLIKTPNIDRIGNEGIRFENSFVTNSICAPSRAVMLTGKYSHLNGLRDNRDTFDNKQLTFPKLLQKHGYQTAIIGKWHLKSEPTGFDVAKVLKGQGVYYNPALYDKGVKTDYIGYTTDILTDVALDTLKDMDPSKPFCMLLHHKAPHRNWMPDARHLEDFEDVELPYPDNLFDDYEGRPAAEHADMRIRDMYLSFDLKLHPEFFGTETGTGGSESYAKTVVQTWEDTYNRLTPEQKAAWDKHYDKVNREFRDKKLQGKELTKWKYQHYMKDYLRCILSVDENVGRVLDYLDQNNLTENTVLVYTSDQGFYLGEHGWYDKRFMYEESLSMPLLMRYPREIGAGQVSKDLVLNLDFASTFLDYADVNIPAEMQGESLRPLIRGRAKHWRDAIYYHYYEYPQGWHKVKKHYGIRTQRYKLIYFYDDDEWELYDLQTDPHEMHNIYDESVRGDLIRSLKQELVQLQKEYGETEVLNI